MSLSWILKKCRPEVSSAVLLLAALCSCAPTENEDLGSARAAVTSCAWDPHFGTQWCVQGDWWMEFSVHDDTVASMQVEIANPQDTVDLPWKAGLADGYSKFVGGADGVPPGTSIRLHATQAAASGGNTAVTEWFPYQQTVTPAIHCGACTPSCAPGTCGNDGCGGTCACGSGSVCTPNHTCCTPSCAPGTCGSDGCGGTCGCASGSVCLSNQTCCTPSCAPGTCGSNGCGGTCGCSAGTVCESGQCVTPICNAPWDPTWRQSSSAGEWWADFKVYGGSIPRSVSLDVVGGGSIPLSYGWGEWTAGAGGLATGTLVTLHATDATGATARTRPFHYLVDTAPLTDACAGTPSTSPTCTPLTRGMVSFTLDDSYASQDTLVRPLLAQYGMKATVYHITNNLSTYGQLPNAVSLAAAGHEVGSHTVTHADLTSLSATALANELGNSKQYLLDHVSSQVESFATPMGLYNATVLAAIKSRYASHRTVNPGLNYMGNDVYQLNGDGITTSTPAAVCAMLADAAASKGWRILVFHDFTSAATSNQQQLYPIADFASILQCAQNTAGLDVVTVKQGADRLRCASP